MQKRWLKLAALPVAVGLVAAACGDDDDSGSSDTTEAASDDGGSEGSQDFEGAEVTITGPERSDADLVAIQAALDPFAEANNINITYSGDADWEANINTQVEAGNPPNISFFPQPGKLADFAREGFVVAVTDDVNATLDEYWIADFQIFGEVDGTQYGVPNKTDLKSLVWYVPDAFEEAGYEVPETLDDFLALVDEMAAAGGPKPLCVGIESGQATGWAATDQTEEFVLRNLGPEAYDQWVSNELAFDSPEIVGEITNVQNLWSEDNVFASGGSIAATAFQDNAVPLLDGDCFMHRQASFFAGFFPEDTAFADGSPGSVDVFYFPDNDGSRPVLTAGTLAAAFDDDPATMAVMEYLATPEYAETRQAAQADFLGGLSGFLSAAQGQDPNVYADLEQQFLQILLDAQVSRFDASDLMPADVGAGTFWSEMTSMINGDVTPEEAAATIQASWPS
ncbi:MAG: carbohydrate ABC transporter substrate-binding protein [Ilumatobacteraceae bacterium]|nr:carbohydrate ABC transporter substrate-binding protein [Ilumatobacteraceae bacterium]